MVSVIIPTYGQPIYLKDCVKSVINQTYLDWELIIVDDNNPNTNERCATEVTVNQFLSDPRIKYIKHPFNKNGASARNTGIKSARGEYIAFLDSDDVYLPTRLEKCINNLIQHPEFCAVYTGCEIKIHGKHHYTFKAPKSGNFLVETLATTYMLGTGSNIFMKAETIKELNGFDERFIRHQDYEFMVRFFQKHSILAMPEVLVIKNNENLNRPVPSKMETVKNLYLTKFKDVINSLDTKDQNYIYHNNYIELAEAYLRISDHLNASKFYKLATSYQHLSVKSFIRRFLFTIKSYVC